MPLEAVNETIDIHKPQRAQKCVYCQSHECEFTFSSLLSSFAHMIRCTEASSSNRGLSLRHVGHCHTGYRQVSHNHGIQVTRTFPRQGLVFLFYVFASAFGAWRTKFPPCASRSRDSRPRVTRCFMNSHLAPSHRGRWRLRHTACICFTCSVSFSTH